MTRAPLRLADRVALRVEYADATPYGSAMTGLCDRIIHATCASACEAALVPDGRDVEDRCREALERCFSPSGLGHLHEGGELRESCRYPDPVLVVPRALVIGTPHGASVRVPLGPNVTADLAGWIADACVGAEVPRHASARVLWDALAHAGALTDAPPLPVADSDGLTFVGHATMSLRARGTSVLVDPFMLGAWHRDDASYRALTAAELRCDAVLVTHGHPDHFDAGSLLRLGRDMPIYVPVVPRESLLSPDIGARLRELGFRAVHPMPWGSSVRIGSIDVRAYPFHGEQPTDREVLHPEIRNEGNAYVADAHDFRVAFIADAGRDVAGDVMSVARQARAAHGPIDVLCGGYRAWRLRPPMYVTSSVARHLLFVPPTLWGTQMQIMNDAEDLWATANAWGASWIVPYANGGAPWYWERGLGPDARAGHDIRPHFDPTEAVLRAAEARGGHAAKSFGLHPGEVLRWRGRELAPVRDVWPGARWPFAIRADEEVGRAIGV